MPPLSKEALLNRIAGAVRDSGWNLLFLNAEHPFTLKMYRDQESLRLLVYIWNVTHGGGSARPHDEYRIQITGIQPNSFVQEPRTKTLILGWWEEAGVFAGFDIRKHSGSLGRSPSFQIGRQCLQDATERGLAAHDKGNQEVAIAFRPDFFGEYVKNLTGFHDFGESPADLAMLDTIAENPDINESEIQLQNQERRETLVSVRRQVRASDFRQRVLTAYRYSCVVCGMQLGLVQAAHIVPVSHETSTDETCNGLALCALHHEAYDQSLVTVWDDYSIRLSESRKLELQSSNRDGRLSEFLRDLRRTVILPCREPDQPRPDYLS